MLEGPWDNIQMQPSITFCEFKSYVNEPNYQKRDIVMYYYKNLFIITVKHRTFDAILVIINYMLVSSSHNPVDRIPGIHLVMIELLCQVIILLTIYQVFI